MSYQITPMTHSPMHGGSYGRLDPVDPGRYRENNPTVVWAFNPWTGTRRNYQDMEADPYGHAIQPPGEAPRVATMYQTGCDAIFETPQGVYNIAPVTIPAENAAEALARALLDPEMYALRVDAEIRNHARRALGVNYQEK